MTNILGISFTKNMNISTLDKLASMKLCTLYDLLSVLLPLLDVWLHTDLSLTCVGVMLSLHEYNTSKESGVKIYSSH